MTTDLRRVAQAAIHAYWDRFEVAGRGLVGPIDDAMFELRDSISAAPALPEPAVKAGWRPIETAPKDREILVYSPPLPPGGRFVVARWYFDDWATAEPCMGDPLNAPPTHWQPLPPAPEIAETGAAEMDHRKSVPLAADRIDPQPAQEREAQALRWATQIATYMGDKFYPEVTQWKPLPDLIGVLSQIDNMTTGLCRAPSQEAAAGGAETQAARDVLAERLRQEIVEGRSLQHDDHQRYGSIARAAAAYALIGSSDGRVVGDELEPSIVARVWPHGWEWKPKTKRINLVRAAALLLAEIERLDRALHQQADHTADQGEKL